MHNLCFLVQTATDIFDWGNYQVKYLLIEAYDSFSNARFYQIFRFLIPFKNMASTNGGKYTLKDNFALKDSFASCQPARLLLNHSVIFFLSFDNHAILTVSTITKIRKHNLYPKNINLILNGTSWGVNLLWKTKSDYFDLGKTKI